MAASRAYLLIRSGVWSQLAASFRMISARQSYRVTIIASEDNAKRAKSSAHSDTPGPEFVLYELDLQNLVGESSDLCSDERIEQILSIIQTESREPAQGERRGDFYGFTSFKVSDSSTFSRRQTGRLFNQVLDQLNIFINCISRNKDYRHDKGALAYNLGRIYGSIRRLVTSMQAWPHPVCCART